VSTLAQACQMTVFTTAPDNFKTQRALLIGREVGMVGLRCLDWMARRSSGKAYGIRCR
jgi:hypothetical protein